jgi:hypothetical protein
MKTVHGVITLVLLAAGSVAAAQTYQQPVAPPPDSSGDPDQMSTPNPSSDAGQTNAPPPSSSASDTSPSSASTKQQMKDCIAQQQAGNSGMTKAQAKKACKHQVNGSPQD